MILSAILAMSENRVIGRNNQLPWHLPEDLKHFKKITFGHPIIMGRKTYDSMGRLLPGRENIIITKQPDLRIPGARIVGSLEEALVPYENQNYEIFVIGGAQIFETALPLVQQIYLTLIHQTVEGDTFFPETPADFKLKSREDHYEGPTPYSFLLLKKEI